MDWNAAIERNRDALRCIVAALVAMVPALPGGGAPTLPRELHRAVLRLLRPAESAARRLVIVAARGMVVILPAARPRHPKPAPTFLHRPGGTGIVLPRRPTSRGSFKRRTLPLFDPLPRAARRRLTRGGVPRISFPGLSQPFAIPVRQSPLPDDSVSAARLAQRLDTLTAVLDDLPKHARRFARWEARRAATARGAKAGALARRTWPLKPGNPPGWQARSTHDLHAVLENVHGLAYRSLENRDTS